MRDRSFFRSGTGYEPFDRSPPPAAHPVEGEEDNSFAAVFDDFTWAVATVLTVVVGALTFVSAFALS